MQASFGTLIPLTILKEEIERIQNLRIICPNLSYRKALEASEIPLLFQRRNDLFNSYFKKLLNPENKLKNLFLINERTRVHTNYVIISIGV